jgi:hypothetical protein
MSTRVGRRLPRPGLMDSVHLERSIKGVDTRSWLAKLLRPCPHANTVAYDRVDHRAGPGSFADNFSGHVCADCGIIVKEVQTL